MIAAILGWTKLPQWALELIVVAAVAGGIWYWQHHLVQEGINTQRAADAIATRQLEAATAQKTADLQAQATAAKEAYEKEHFDNLNYRDSHPLQPVRLCIATSHSGSVMPQTGVAHSGNASSGTAAANVPAVPDGNSGGGAGAAGPDISELLGLLAAKADNVSAVLREYQKR
jgi:hypothetical protein